MTWVGRGCEGRDDVGWDVPGQVVLGGASGTVDAFGVDPEPSGRVNEDQDGCPAAVLGGESVGCGYGLPGADPVRRFRVLAADHLQDWQPGPRRGVEPHRRQVHQFLAVSGMSTATTRPLRVLPATEPNCPTLTCPGTG